MVPSWDSPNPACPLCDQQTKRMMSAPAFHGGAKAPAGPNEAPTSWEGLGNGNPEVIHKWRKQLDTHAKLAEKHPELQVKREAIAAHEGAFERKPLTYRELAERAKPSGVAETGAREAAKARKVDKPSTPKK